MKFLPSRRRGRRCKNSLTLSKLCSVRTFLEHLHNVCYTTTSFISHISSTKSYYRAHRATLRNVSWSSKGRCVWVRHFCNKDESCCLIYYSLQVHYHWTVLKWHDVIPYSICRRSSLTFNPLAGKIALRRLLVFMCQPVYVAVHKRLWNMHRYL